MQKEFDEKREVSVRVSRTVCDVCGDVAKEDGAIIRILVKREEPQNAANVYASGYSYHHLDICSVGCLAKNINGITLVLNTKIIPSIPDNKLKQSSGFGGSNSISNTFTGTTLTSTGSISAQWSLPVTTSTLIVQS